MKFHFLFSPDIQTKLRTEKTSKQTFKTVTLFQATNGSGNTKCFACKDFNVARELLQLYLEQLVHSSGEALTESTPTERCLIISPVVKKIIEENE